MEQVPLEVVGGTSSTSAGVLTPMFLVLQKILVVVSGGVET